MNMSREWRALPTEVRETLTAHQEEPPVKLATIVGALGIPVRAATLAAGVSGEIRPDERSPAGFAIKVNRHDSPRRQRFTVAHELAHYLLHREQIGAGIKDDVLYRSNLSDRREAEANRLAADILMPSDLVDAWIDKAKTIGAEDVVAYLADQFEVSEAAMRIRLGIA